MTSAPVRFVLFDVGGVLLRLPHVREQVWAYARARDRDVSYGEVAVAVTEAIRADFALGPRDLIASRQEEDRRMTHMFGEIAIRLGLSEDAAADLRDVAYYTSSGTLYPEVLSVLATLKRRRIPCGVVSNAPPSLLACLVRLGVAEFFDPIVVSADVGAMKPEPTIFEFALERAQVAPEECLFLDDLPANVAGARALGLRAVHVRRSYTSLAPSDDTLAISSLEAVLRVIDGDTADLTVPQGLSVPV